ncbi:RNA 2',3'-cyclic phosphodiesterase [Bacillus sp. DX1.1]|uniref:RNA 2',3'-cyclic phosphodiesterase n=1 Tax=unclassified Bacillus (in: firmicutes) TaxID=185979 RepID=UPI0025704641|nr:MULTISPECIES: RNA 2',3'-cyclic phosphodiesterase [unclassified Bacillus (in: firmicutes)]MDM5156868.1 RNA 2',3'-cyclic phosphodiesterase [Bacillus sp. DX1.1]WJE81113.1 RNA 2',3'-cyclic phosphodiesterase [Bacillus sp. DX3.1]
MVKHYFVAVTLPQHIKEMLGSFKEEMKGELPFRSWVHQEDYHITLAFLGSASADQLAGVERSLQQLISTETFSLTLQGFSTFGVAERPRVFWAGVKENSALFQLQKQVHTMCERNGFTLETRPYHPHITVARKWLGENQFDLKSLKQIETVLFQTDTVTLYESQINQTPKYKPIYEIKLHTCKA